MKYFKESEFECDGINCFDKMIPKFIDQLDLARSMSKVKWQITSSWRNEEHNKAVGGKSDSEHLEGLAVDISAPTSQHKYEIVSCALMAGFTRIGIGKDFIHIGGSKGKPQNVIWTY